MSNTKFNVTVGRLHAEGWGLAVGRVILSWLVIHPSWSLETVIPSGFNDWFTATIPEPLPTSMSSLLQSGFLPATFIFCPLQLNGFLLLHPCHSGAPRNAQGPFLSICLDQPFSTRTPHLNNIQKTDFSDYFIIFPRLHYQCHS